VLPTAFILCSLVASSPPIDLSPELLERLKGHFDDSMVDYVPVVIARLEWQLEWAKKKGRPRAEVDDIEKALEAWRKGGSLPSRVSPESLTHKARSAGGETNSAAREARR